MHEQPLLRLPPQQNKFDFGTEQAPAATVATAPLVFGTYHNTGAAPQKPFVILYCGGISQHGMA